MPGRLSNCRIVYDKPHIRSGRCASPYQLGVQCSAVLTHTSAEVVDVDKTRGAAAGPALCTVRGSTCTAQGSTSEHSMAQHDLAGLSMTQHGTAWRKASQPQRIFCSLATVHHGTLCSWRVFSKLLKATSYPYSCTACQLLHV
jgi:hypothetical protein